MDVVELKVTGMSCDHCRRAVDQAVRAVAGVGGVAVDLEAGEVRVEFEGDREGTLREGQGRHRRGRLPGGRGIGAIPIPPTRGKSKGSSG